MATTDIDPQDEAPQDESAVEALEHGAYEVIRNRLSAAGRKLRGRLEKLNDARKDVFGAIETTLLATERVTTGHNCVPRDMTPVGDCFLFGYNVHLGLKTVTKPADLFAVYRFEDHTFTPQPLELIADERFERDLEELFKYYRNTVFARFAVIGPHLFMVFRTSDDVRDVKTFKWLIEGDKLRYIDNRSEQDYRFPPQHEFEWTRTTRDMHTAGEHPHVSIEDRVFVETTEGDLTVKIENNTDTGEGIYAEPVDDPDQTLDDADISYAIVGNLILLKVRPYKEEPYRYIVYSEKIQQARRLDSIARACVLLPGDHGLIFSNGYMLQTGECKTFEGAPSEMEFAQRVASPNGEDYLFVFYNRREGVYVLLPYNLIEQRVDTPVVCNGYSIFEDGRMLYFKAQDVPQRHHALQIWQTPFTGPDYQPETQSDSFLFKVGNRDIVRGMAECHELLNLIGKEDTYAGLFVDIAKKSGDVLDAYYWLDKPDAANLAETLRQVKEAADAAIGEFEKVQSVRRATEQQLREVSERTREIVSSILARRFENIGDFVTSMVDLRGVRGEIISLRDLRYVDRAKVDQLEAEVAEHADRVANQCVGFLLGPEALRPYEQAVEEHRGKIDGLATVSDAKQLEERIATTSSELEMLIETVSNLQIDDATKRTEIIDNISAIFTTLNQVRAAIKSRLGDLMQVEGRAEFSSQLKLLGQSVVNYLDVCDIPDKCDEYLTKVMVQIEELEGRFAEFDEFVVQLAEKREEIYNAFEGRKLRLVEARNKRAGALMTAAERILGGVKVRVDALETVSEINGYFAADLMIEKIREIVGELEELGDSVKVDDIQSRLKTIHEDAVRQLKDRLDLYEDGRNVIRLGKHRFSVNNQAFDLSIVTHDGRPCFHLTGTNYFDPITDPEFLATRDVWDQEVVSENESVYRAEYLAHQILRAADTDDVPEVDELRSLDDEQLFTLVQRFMTPRYSEAYVKGVHDQDAAILLRALLELESSIGLLRYHPRARALAQVFWMQFADAERKQQISAVLEGFGKIRTLFPEIERQQRYIGEARRHIAEYVEASRAFPPELVDEAGEYLFEELTRGGPFAVSARARDLYRAFRERLEEQHYAEEHRESVGRLREDPTARFLLERDWVEAFTATRNQPVDRDYVDEAAVLLMADSLDLSRVVEVATQRQLEGLQGNHSLIEDGRYRLDYHVFRQKLSRYEAEVVPRFTAYARLKRDLAQRERDRLRLAEFRPRVLTSFVRNKLIDAVYLPLVGDNLAKQIGTAGEQKRTDRMGLLLLISPPGYGKTTLMEYMANRLGLVFMKINGPALGHQVTSIDPAGAPNAAAREELQKLNLAFEMGDNVMIYVDDIQHCNPEFLQKFISLCDAQRKIEGVFRGKTRTYDLRGKKVAVVMAGNPYTESGEKFKIPDMLANRADTYNLGEIIGGSADAFELSYLENALTSNPVLAKIATRSQKDVYGIIRMAEQGEVEGVELEGNYSLAEVNEMVGVMRKLLRVRDVVLAVNQEYIRSAGTADDYRTEPPFKLQGSYRNMNRMAERVVGVMNDEELETLIFSSYRNDAQTLTTGMESNMLKFKELTGRLTEEETERWESIKRTYARNVQLKGIGDDAKFGQLVVQLTALSDGMDAIRKAVSGGVEQMIRAEAEAAGAGPPPPLQASFDPKSLETMKSWIDELRLALAEREAERAAAAEPVPQEIQVVSRVPSAILNVLRQQFTLMKGWIKPIFEQSNRQSAEIEKLAQLVEENLGGYQELIRQLEEAAAKDEKMFEGLARHKIDVGTGKKKSGKGKGAK